MREQYLFDLKKNIWSSTNVVIFIAFLILMLGTFFIALGTKDASMNDMMRAYSEAGDNIQVTVKALNEKKHLTKDEQALLAQKQKQQEYISNISMDYSGLLSPIPMNTVKETDQAILDYAKYNLREAKKGNKNLVLISYKGKEVDNTLLGRKKDVAFYTYLVQHNTMEIPANKVDAPAATYLPYQFLYHLSPLIILAVFLVQLGQLFTSEKRDGTISFMNNLPTDKLRILVARMLTFLTITIPLFLGACLTTYIITGIKFGWGSWQYPLVYSADGKTPSIMTVGHYFAMLCALFLIIVLFLMVLSALVGLISGNFGVNIVVCAVPLVFATKQVLTAGIIAHFTKFLPSSYFDASKVILHETDWSILGIGGGVLVILLWTAVLFGLCVLILRRRERL